MRRIMMNYFGYNVFYVMNITDIDDKIIKRARHNHLYKVYVNEERTLEELIEDTTTVTNHYENLLNKTTDPDKKSVMHKTFVR